jgi:hypothetical protein
MEFQEFEKIARLNREVIVTEKIDGTNGQVKIVPAGADGDQPNWDRTASVLLNGVRYDIYAGSRSKWITPNADNYGFARWVYEHADELLQLGEGAHFGEWWGSGIQRRYGLTEKRWSLFNVGRWVDSRNAAMRPTLTDKEAYAPACCHVVPTLATGIGTEPVGRALEVLHRNGSIAAPGFFKPEGIVAFHTHARTLFKVTLERDEEPKSLRKSA